MASAAQLLPLVCLLAAFLGPVTALSSPADPASPDPRLLFKFIIISPDSCNSNSGGTGICYSQQDCSSLRGTSDGNCAKGLGVCCTFTRTCNQQTQYQGTTFTNPSYPNPETEAMSNCELTVFPMNNNICQVRLDLEEFTLAQPNVNGKCLDDVMIVTGGSSTVPKICGENAGQHMYVEVDPNSSSSMKITIDTSTVGAKWKIKVTQIACTSTSRAPDGCLQYFTNTSGVVSSFNYPRPTPTAAPTATRQLAEQNYGVCIQSQSGYCSVTWSPPENAGEYFFSMTGDPSSVQPGTPGISLVGVDCTTDYVIIPGGVYDTTATLLVPTQADRFCGLGFPNTVTSSITPHVLYVVTDAVETVLLTSDIYNQGFSLRYRVNAC